MSVVGVTLAHYVVGDAAAEAHAMVSLVEQGWALQTEVARAFCCDVRTVRRDQRRVEEGGLVALGRAGGYPKGRPRIDRSRVYKIDAWKAEGLSNRQIAQHLGVTEKAIRKTLRRLGWKEEPTEPPELPFTDADPNLSASTEEASDAPPQRALQEADAGDPTHAPSQQSADPNLSALVAEDLPVSLDTDPDDRRVDRLLACLGALDDAAPVFGRGTQVPGVGVLLAIPALLESGVLDIAREIYSSLGPAFCGLRTTIVTFLLMALLRIRRTEGLKEHSPRDLGRVLGLDRAPEMKTLRNKLKRLAAVGRAEEFGRALAKRRVAGR